MVRHGLKRTLLATVLALLAALLATPTATAAPTAETEPNDTIFQVGSMINAEGMTGAMNTAGDVDYFWLGVKPQRQIRLNFSVTGCATTATRLNLTVQEPEESPTPLLTTTAASNAPSTNAVTTPGVAAGATRYLLVRVEKYFGSVWTEVGCQYALTVQDASGGATDAVDPTPPPAFPLVDVPEPNDLDSQAYGPLSADVDYAGAIETDNDVDKLFFKVRAGQTASVRLAVGRGTVHGYSEPSGFSASYLTEGRFEFGSTSATSTDQVFTLSLRGNAGSTYQIRVTPGAALVTTPPQPAAKVRVKLRANKSVVRRGGFVTLKGRVNRTRGKVVIYQKMVRRGSRWVQKAKRKVGATGRFRHRDDVRTGSRRYKACYQGKCSKAVLVRMR